MNTIKYTSPIFTDIYSNNIIIYQGIRLKSINLIHLIDIFLNRYIIFNKDNIKLNSRILKWLYGSSYSKYIDYLVENKFIYLWKNYSSGYKSKTYKLTEKTKEYGIVTAIIKMDIKLLNKLNKLNTASEFIDDTIKNKLINDLYKITINLEKSTEWLNTNFDINDKALEINLSACQKINNKDIYYSFDKFGRFHTNYTILKKEIRNNYLKINNNDIAEIDITNSQPFFLYILMKEHNFKIFNGFDDDVLNGTIYEKLCDISGISRKEAKIKVYSILFGRNNINEYWNELFNKLYPDVYKWIVSYKEKHKTYKSIAQNLQKIESNFIFNKLIPKIIDYNKDIAIITIHDSIIFEKQYYNAIKDIFFKVKKETIDCKYQNEEIFY